MNQTLQAACDFIGVEPEQVMSWRVYDTYIALVIWPGPKHKIPLEWLDEPESEVKPPFVQGRRTGQSGTVPKDTGPVVLATKAAARLAEERSIDLTHVRGSGKHGRILARDILEMNLYRIAEDSK